MASGNTLCVIKAIEAEENGTAQRAIRANRWVLAFDDTTDETAEFTAYMPDTYAGGGITVTLIWQSEDQTTGAVVWDVALKSVSDDADDLDTKSFAAANSVTATTASASGECDYATVTFTDGADMDSIAAEELFEIQINRDANNGSDDMTNDAQLKMIVITET